VSPAAAEVEQDAGAWFMSLSQGSLGDDESRLRWWLDLHARFSSEADGFEQSIVRPGVGLQWTESQSLWLGYAWIATRGAGDAFSQEHRIWQQHLWADSLASWDFLCRSRLEQRFFDTDGDLGLRYRQFLKVNYWLERSQPLYLTAYHEVFINLNDTRWGARSGLDRHRLFLGFGLRPPSTPDLTVEIGYLNQFANRSRQANRMTHIASFNLFSRF
jgi:hypothetical protein